MVGFTGAVKDGARSSGYPIRRAQEALLSGTTERRTSSVRSVIADSWLRSVAAGVSADRSAAPITLEPDLVRDYREDHPLSRVFPLLYDVLGRAAEDCDSLMAVADEHGQLLWVCGQPGVLRRAEAINFVEGARWDEANAGTNAPGTALRLDAPVIIHAAEHFARPVQRWSCAAAPIHDPVTQAILGIVDITGGPDVATPQTIAMIRAAARMAESELARIIAVESHGHGVFRSWPIPRRRPPGAPGDRLDDSDRSGLGRRLPLRLLGLGRPDCSLELEGRTLRLSRRHSEIVVILSRYPDGLTGDQLSCLLYPEDVTSSTMRAELVRLRALLGEDVLASRPYRLLGEVDADWTAVQGLLAAGQLQQALATYRGPLLPQSEAPGVCDYRDELQRRLRVAVLDSGRPELMVSWTRARWGADDLQMWQRQLAVLPVGSPLRPLARAEIAKLDSDYRS